MSREMKNSGVDWIGEIPANWDLKPLKAILAERKESNDPIKTDYILSLTVDKGVIPYSEKTGGGNKAKEDLSAYKLAYPNDIVLNSMNVLAGSVGLSSYFGCVSPVYYMLYVRNNSYSIKYYNNIFQTKEFQGNLRGLGNGIMIKESSTGKLNTIRMRIPMSKLNSVMLPIPPAPEQQLIADYLEQKCTEIDRNIEKTKISIEEYKSYKQTVITEVVTKGLNSNAIMKDSGFEWIGQIPQHWKVRRLRYVGFCQNGISKGGEYFGTGYPFVSYGDVYKNIELPHFVEGLAETTDSEREAYSVKKGDVFFTRTSETIEEIGLAATCTHTIENATFAGFLIRFRPFEGLLDKNYSKYYFRSQKHRLFFVKEMNIVTRASLSQELLKKLPVLLPDLREQQLISDHLDTICAEIDNIISKKQFLISELETYKKSLIYECVTGKKEV
ncbi:restriction endonuclease subunit S [Paenibacillus sp. EPM92]|uniref:restriction endonuclease subunit S n=1 Tax=Paenibacillus sp. EPM92 TaxID=1561195 RepID=UPI001915C11A|nr:restriction endonuclease subunit S [Paenibacillus sp. EPM92]